MTWGRLVSLVAALIVLAPLSACSDEGGPKGKPAAQTSRPDKSDAAAGAEAEPAEGFARYGYADRQAFVWLARGTSTRSERFAEVEGLAGLEICDGELGASAAVSISLKGGAAAIRVIGTNTSGSRVRFRPQKVAVPPASRSRVFHWTFLAPDIASLRTFSVEWRSRTGEEVAATGGTLTLYYGSEGSSSAGCA